MLLRCFMRGKHVRYGTPVIAEDVRDTRDPRETQIEVPAKKETALGITRAFKLFSFLPMNIILKAINLPHHRARRSTFF